MEMIQVQEVFKAFDTQTSIESFTVLNTGHINDTYLIETKEGVKFVLQRINSNVFSEAALMIQNKVLVSLHLQKKMQQYSKDKLHQHVLSFVKTQQGAFFYVDHNNHYWNLSFFIKGSITYEKTPNTAIAYQAGKATSEFLALTADFPLESIKTILPDFHSIDNRYRQFLTALNAASPTRLKTAELLIDFVQKEQENMRVLDEAITMNKLPLRLTHNDTKISNILFNASDIAICLIDTDTVMPGVLHYDYADAIRTICNTADEDESDLLKVQFHLDYFKSYTLGFSENIKENCTLEEVKLLPISLQVLPFIMGLRFLTDYLNEDVYYKTNYPAHNLDRAANQFTLVKEIQQNFSEIKTYITQVFSF
ncbi:phosphotransferase enzyme family protein [Polaribacter pacificus]|nr:aminoglycoside phosphotransferase family protein [Polaribacter pacificus]